MERLELEQGVDVKDLGLEDVLEEEHVKVVADVEVLEELQVEGVEPLEVAEVDLVEAQAVESAGVEDGTSGHGVGGGVDDVAGLLGDRGGDGGGGEEAGEDGGELHDDGVEVVFVCFRNGDEAVKMIVESWKSCKRSSTALMLRLIHE